MGIGLQTQNTPAAEEFTKSLESVAKQQESAPATVFNHTVKCALDALLGDR